MSIGKYLDLLRNPIRPLKPRFLPDFRSRFVVYPIRVCLLPRLKNLQKNRRFFWPKRVKQEVHYRQNPRFALIDLAIAFSSLIFNPYRACRKQGLGPYGETPLATLQRIAQFCELAPSDHWFELGSGRGRGCFWISLFVGCRATGIERIPLFAHLSRLLSLFAPSTRFHCADLHTADLSQATCIYLYSTCMSEHELASLIPKIAPGTKIITISAPLPSCIPLGSFPVSFPWGDTEAYLHIKD